MCNDQEGAPMTTPAQPVQSHGRRVGLLTIGVILLVIGVALSYFALTRRWGYYAGIPLDTSQLIPEVRAALTIWWWGQGNNFCGPLPAIWPAIVILSAAPLIVAAIRQRVVSPVWSRISLLGAVFGAITVLVAMWTFVEFSHFSDSNWVYAADTGTLAMALAGYALLFLAILALRQASRGGAAPTS
jgi:hypothetical protein